MATAAATGYSGTPLLDKLGFKDGQRVLFVDMPASLQWLAESKDFASIGRSAWNGVKAERDLDVIHAFTASRAVLADYAKPLMDAIARNGMVWLSWPKKSSKVATDITEDVIREVVLPIGLVDVKVCAVDAVWSGLKLVIRKQLR